MNEKNQNTPLISPLLKYKHTSLSSFGEHQSCTATTHNSYKAARNRTLHHNFEQTLQENRESTQRVVLSIAKNEGTSTPIP
ncbi:hypothetical protein GJ744_007499 [Endocarpon pusillum]|uniref:Uncharacterized protein n=1 Tax=Endocarpon pusillum TaxID=364733 RepID=A0A8H7AKH7_9EURO|nr:hypothetical protein GJ744_007499 [Endocarpon pusillum]